MNKRTGPDKVETKVGFWLGWKRSRHIKNGHPYASGKLLEKLHSENHPHSDSEHIYTVNIMECQDCGLVYHDAGLERRKPSPVIAVEHSQAEWELAEAYTELRKIRPAIKAVFDRDVWDRAAKAGPHGFTDSERAGNA